MNSAFGEIFLFLTNLAWKSRMMIPMLVTTVFLIMDVRLQIEINIQSGQVAAAELEQLDDSDDDEPHIDEADNDLAEEYTEDSIDHDFMFYCDVETVADDEGEEEDDDDDNAANRIRRSLGLS